jgi:hypothetical protein
MMWCYAGWCDDMMRKDDANVEDTQPRAHTGTHHLCVPLGTIGISLPFIFRLHRLFFGVSSASLRNVFWTSSPSILAVSPLTFRCKFCIPLGTSFELLRLIFWWYLALHSLWNDFWAENLQSLRNDFFVASSKLTLRSLRNIFFL